MEPIALTPWLEHLAKHLPVARAGADPEGVHQVRVAAGRLVVWLHLAGRRVLRDDLCWLRGSAGRLRELDVLVHSDPPAPWLEWLEERRAACRREFEAALDERRLTGLLIALPLLPPLPPARARERAGELQARALRKGRRVARRPRELDHYHALRKTLRRLRFAREWLGQGTKPLRALQSSLGGLNDAAVTLRLLEEYPGRAALGDYRAALEARLEELRRESLARWERYARELEGDG